MKSKIIQVEDTDKRYFKVLAGSHSQDGVLYKKGSIITSYNDLVQLFGEGKFKEVDALEYEKAQKKVPQKKVINVAPKEEVEEDDEDEESSFGEDVTDRFSSAEDNDLKVFKSDEGYTVVDSDEPSIALNKKPLLKVKVAGFIEKYINSDE